MAIAVVALGAGLGAPPADAAKRSLQLSIRDSSFSAADPATRALWLDRARGAGADGVDLAATWRAIASDQPADPANPADPKYTWTSLDAAVRDAAARGLAVTLTINRAPDFAEGGNRDPDARPGTWRPDPAKLGQFARAAATRYSGSYPDPVQPGRSLPRVRDWKIWAEPNLYLNLMPQVHPRKGRSRPLAPAHFRKMLNVAYAAIKGVSQANTVVAGGTAPFAHDSPGDLFYLLRLSPVDFWREVLCLRGKKLKKAKCPGGRAHFDVLGHNPLSWGAGGASPWKSASEFGGKDDVIVPDMHKLRRLVRKARARGTIRPRRGTEVWATELLWDTNPPPYRQNTVAQQAAFLADALYLLWRQGVSRVVWQRIVDIPPSDSSLTTGAGLYFVDGTAKPSLEAFRFPFVALRKKGKTMVWGRAPSGGKVRIQRAGGGTVAKLGTGRSNVFSGRIRAGGRLQAVASNGDESLLRRPR